MRFPIRFLACLATLVGLGMPLQAQLDSRLNTTTDILDVYKSAPAKPELLTIFDFSGSMYAMYWDARYYTGAGQAAHGAQWFSTSSYNSGDWPGLVPVLNSSGLVRMYSGTGYYQHYDTSITVNCLGRDGSGSFVWGKLVRPNGTEVPISGTYTQAGLETLVRQASHVRMTATYGGVTRTIDLPIPWAVMNRVSSTSASSILTAVPDPSGGPSVQPDTIYTVTNQNNIVNDRNDSYFKIGRLHYNVDYLWWIFFGKDVKNATKDGSTPTSDYVVPDVSTAKAWENGLPEMTRFQALKNAVVRSWLANQTQVWWGYRFLDGSEESYGSGYNVKADNGSASSQTVTRDIRLFRTAQNSSSADPGLRHFTDNIPETSTPLTYALANAYTQLALTSDSSSTFGTSSGGGQSGTESPIPTCRKSFVVAFTDGIANDSINGGSTSAIGRSKDPYAGSGGVGTEAQGNTNLTNIGGVNALVPGTSNAFNIWTLAGTAAHFKRSGYTGPGSVSATYSVPTVAPFLITTRGATTSNPRRIRTMTVGMSLAGTIVDSNSGKADLYRAALYGNPESKTWYANTPPFNPDDPNNSDPQVNPFFFDAQEVSQLTAAMTAIINEVTAASASISAPSSPLVGLNLGKQAYLGLFQTARTGPIWEGDLVMAGLKVSATGIQFLDENGTSITDITTENASWSAASHLQNRSWNPAKATGRKVYTTLSTTTTTLTRLDDNSSSFTNAMFNASTDTERKQLIRFMLGAAPAAVADPTLDQVRTNVMGDIISSSPIAVEYPLEDAKKSSYLSTWLGGEGATATDKHFRVIFVSDNQGYLHAFGEVSGEVMVGANKAIHGVVEELWAFVPHQNLPAAKYLNIKANPHIYLFDGAPRVYHDDIPSSGEPSGNRIIDGTDTARLIIGMGKGGRSYFGFDIKDPFTPTLSWSLNPDSSSDEVVKRMALATSRPSLGRVDVSAGGFKDMVFLGGGLSTLEIDTVFSGAAPAGFGTATKMGRSIVALDVKDGSLYKTWDLNATSFTNVGSISSGVIPFQVLSGTKRTQRLYFTDQPTALASGTPRGSAIWALGTTLTNSSGLRLESSNIDLWTTTGTAAGAIGLRKVYQAPNGVAASSLPGPFNLAEPYPVTRTGSPLIRPLAVGVALGLGDRWDPMDSNTLNPEGTNGAGRNKFVLVFDRNDSAILNTNSPSVTAANTNGLTDANLVDLTTVSTLGDSRLQPGNSSYYLANGYGYYLNLPAGSASPKTGSSRGGSNYYYPKIVTSPVVLKGVGFFTTFNGVDTAGACGGSGNSKTYRICDIFHPVFNSGNTIASASSFDATSATCSGVIGTWVNIPGELTGIGTTGIIQTGQGHTSDGSSGTLSNAGAQGLGGMANPGNIGFRPRTWRIVR